MDWVLTRGRACSIPDRQVCGGGQWPTGLRVVFYGATLEGLKLDYVSNHTRFWTVLKNHICLAESGLRKILTGWGIEGVLSVDISLEPQN